MRTVVLLIVCLSMIACSSAYWQQRWLGRTPEKAVALAPSAERTLVVPLRFGRNPSDASRRGTLALASGLTAAGVQAMAEPGERVSPDPETYRLISELTSEVDFYGTAPEELSGKVAERYNADRIVFVDVFTYETYWRGIERRSKVGMRALSLNVATGELKDVTRTGDGRGFGVGIRDVERRTVAELVEALK